MRVWFTQWTYSKREALFGRRAGEVFIFTLWKESRRCVLYPDWPCYRCTNLAICEITPKGKCAVNVTEHGEKTHFCVPTDSKAWGVGGTWYFWRDGLRIFWEGKPYCNSWTRWWWHWVDNEITCQGLPWHLQFCRSTGGCWEERAWHQDSPSNHFACTTE